MRSFSAFIILFFLASISFAQIQFEKGYIINQNNKRIECLIKNMQWNDNPVEISYKLNPSDKPTTGNVTSIKEFGIGNTYKFVGANVKVDLLNKPTEGTQNELDPVWTRENLFLKVILEGKANLYQYNIGKVERFFYSLTDTVITPLTYKQIHKASTLIKNNDFRQQLWDKVRLPKTTWELMKTVDYNEAELKDYFKAYNGNFDEPIVELVAPETKKLFLNLKLTPGINFTSAEMTVIESVNRPHLNFESKAGLRLGVEAELIIPFNEYRWGILFEPNFQSYSSEVTYGTKPTTFEYKSVEFPIGLRYYMHLNDNSKVFLNGFYVPGVALDSKIDYYSLGPEDKTLKVETASNLALGGGFEFNNFSLEARYYTPKDFTKSVSAQSDKYNRFAVILGYKFLKKNLR